VTSTEETQDTSLFRYKIDLYIAYNKVLVESKMAFSEKQTTNFTIDLPYDARKITMSLDDFELPALLETNKLRLYLHNNKQVEYSYISEDLLEKDAFIGTMTAPFDTELLRITLSLPEKAVLEKPVRQGSVQGSSVFPKPKRLETDGQVIKVVWDFEDVKKGDEIALYARYKKPARYLLPLILGIIGIVVILAVISYIVYKANGRRTRHKPDTNRHSASEHHKPIEHHLKEDEQQVVNVLKLKEGRCEQGTLRIATGFSKAKLSGLLKEMQERKLIHKEKRGKKNLVFLK
jgi:uncharacterized membrane protein